jgi:hypothetical protein
MRALLCAVFCTVLLVIPQIAAAGRVTFDRIHPARRDVGRAADIALVYALGDSDSITTFIDVFLYETNQAGTLRVYDVRHVNRARPTAVALRVGEFRCHSRERSGEGSTRNFEGNRVRRKHVFADAICEARIDIVRGAVTESYRVRGEGTSPRVERLSREEIQIALDQAARYAAIAAAEEITPRRVRETIALDPAAPGYDEAAPMVDAGLLRHARVLWEGLMSRNRESAALRFNLGAVTEAMGDVRAAAEHYAAARALAPNERRYRSELELFKRRNGQR